LKLVIASLSGLLTPRRVKLPSAATGVSPSKLIVSALKLIVGNLAVSKKSAFFSSSSSSTRPVSIESAAMATSMRPYLLASIKGDAARGLIEATALRRKLKMSDLEAGKGVPVIDDVGFGFRKRRRCRDAGQQRCQ
jgi:hypothetical protein